MEQKLLNISAVVQLNISIWSARAKLEREDLKVPEDQLPPEAVASLGSKRLFPIEDMRIFGTLKAQAFKYMKGIGVPFMKGWIVEESMLPRIDAVMDKIKHEFDNAVHDFVMAYDRKAGEWCAQYPEWGDMLRRALPDVNDIESKFGFGWHGFKIEPPRQEGMKSNTIEQDIQKVPEKAKLGALDELVELYNGPFNPGKSITKKTLRPLKAYIDKLNALSFANPALDRYAGKLQVVYDDMEAAKNIDAPYLRQNFRDAVESIVGSKLAQGVLNRGDTAKEAQPEEEEHDLVFPVKRRARKETEEVKPEPMPEQAASEPEHVADAEQEQQGVSADAFFDSFGLF